MLFHIPEINLRKRNYREGSEHMNVERGITASYHWIDVEQPLNNNAAFEKAHDENAFDDKKGLLWISENSTLVIDEMYYENGNVELTAHAEGVSISLNIPITKGMTIDIIEAYMKKLGQLKTLMELANKIDKEGD